MTEAAGTVVQLAPVLMEDLATVHDEISVFLKDHGALAHKHKVCTLRGLRDLSSSSQRCSISI